MSLLPKSLLAFGLLLASVLAPSGTALAANNYEQQTLIRKCELQDSYACEELGIIYQDGGYGVTQDYAKAAKYYAKGCVLQSGFACGCLGALYYDGIGVSQSYAKAVKYFTEGCELQDGVACRGLGAHYYKGQGVTQDYAKAVKYFTKGCELQGMVNIFRKRS